MSWIAPRALVDPLIAAVDRFLDHPVDQPAVDAVVTAIEAIASAGPGGTRRLETIRQKRMKRDGSFGRRYVAVGWPLDGEGRKHYAGTALLSDTGEPIALARSTWIQIA